MKHKITRKLLLFILSLLLLFSVLMGVLFTRLFSSYTLTYQKEELQDRAEAISQNLSSFLQEEQRSGRGMGSGGMGSGGMGSGGMGSGNMGSSHMGGYIPVLRALESVVSGHVWVVDQEESLILETRGREIEQRSLPEGANLIIEEALEGSVAFSEDFSGLLDVQSLTVGVPIIGHDQGILGAVLLHTPITSIESSIKSGMNILLLSSALALISAMVFGVIFSLKFVAPLKKMNKTAYLLSKGDYQAKTGVDQQDEIGELAREIDALSYKLHEASQESLRLEKSRQDFISSVSHELRTPVTVLRGSLEALEDKIIKEPLQVEAYHHQMYLEVLALQRLVDDLLNLTRLQNPDFKFDKELINLSMVLSDVTKAAESLEPEKQLRLHLESPYETLPILGDYGRLRQMFLAVLHNAQKFSMHHGEIFITVEQAPAHVLVKIRDQGMGMDPETLSHIFDRFYKSTHKENAKGTGLGLAIALEIAKRHEVKLQVESTLGQGTTFFFYFPR